jgi:hypothetical protein
MAMAFGFFMIMLRDWAQALGAVEIGNICDTIKA